MRHLLSLSILFLLICSADVLAQDNGDYPEPFLVIGPVTIYPEVLTPQDVVDCASALETLSDPIRGPLAALGTCVLLLESLIAPPPPQNPPDPPQDGHGGGILG